MHKIMGIDYGDARTGVAVSDLLCSIVGSTAVVPSRNTEKAIADIVRMAKENEVGTIVVGLPRNMDGTRGESAKRAEELAAKLEEMTGLPVKLWDERMTTVSAIGYLNQTDVRGKKRKQVVDTVAATIILQDFLDSRKLRGN